MKKKRLGFGVMWVLLICAAPVLSVPYMTVADGNSFGTDFHTGCMEAYNLSQGLDYGAAKIEWSYWSYDGYWYYSYKVYNNEAGNPDDRTDDYHFGHIYDSGTTTPINIFDLDFGVQLPEESVGSSTELVITSTLAGSSSGGPAWGPRVDEQYIPATDSWVITGADWSATRPDPDGDPIEPTKWDIVKIKGQDTWTMLYGGDTSTDDSDEQYFQIASIYAPGLISGHVANGLYSAETVISGDIYGPAVIPEPASILILGLGAIGLFSRCSRKNNKKGL